MIFVCIKLFLHSTEILACNYPQTHANPFPKRANSMAYLQAIMLKSRISLKQTSIQLLSICHHLGCLLLRYCWHVHRKGGTPYGFRVQGLSGTLTNKSTKSVV